MPVEKSNREQEKPGLLRLGFKEGDPVPYLEGVGPTRVSKEGSVEWQPILTDLFLLNAFAPFKEFLFASQRKALLIVLRAFQNIDRALLGYPISRREDWGISLPPLPENGAKSFNPWEEAPHPVQQYVFQSAVEYLRNQLESSTAESNQQVV